ncbi:MAG TPA: GNAT family N-acetyltransferase, partial [Candidatus Udaeobacter sp.]|nr:GNAT family N-acetyltransferase [Candidatus Udaeobacter sp.]
MSDVSASKAQSQPTAASPAAQPAEIRLRDHRPGDESVIVAVLNKVQHGAWGSEALWRWRHGGRPGFRSDEVVLAMVGDELVGSFHSAVLPMKLEDGLVVPMSFDGDYAVLPEYRKRDIVVQAHELTDERLRARQVVFRGGFTSRELNERLYHRRFGYVFVPGVTTQYRKILGPGPLAPRVTALGESICMRTAVRRALAQPLKVA